MNKILEFLQNELSDQKYRQTRLIENEAEFRKTMGDENYEKEVEYQQEWINCIKHLQEQYKRNVRKY